MNFFEEQEVERFFKLWEDRIRLGKDINPQKRSLELLGKDFKWFNKLKLTDIKFRERVVEIENRVIEEEDDEINEFLTELYLEYKREGVPDSDIKKVFGKNFSLDQLHKSNPKLKKTGETFYEKYKIKHDPKSSDPLERLLYQEEYKKRLLDKRKRDEERSIEKRLKRQEKIEKIKSQYVNQSENIDQFDLDKDWREERLIQSVEKKIKHLEGIIEKNEKLNELRIEKSKELLEKKVEKQKELDKQRRKRDKEKVKLKDKKNREVEKIRNKRIKDREELEKKRILKRKEREESRRTSKFQSQILLEEVKDSINKVEIPKEIKDFIKYSDRYQKKLYDVNKKIVFKYCGDCGEHKKWTHFYSNGKNKLSTYCISCTRRRKGLIPGSGRRGEFYKGEQRFKVNENGNKTHIKCTTCGEFKKVKEFNYLYRSSSVCKSCFVEIPNNVLTRKGEFRIIDGKRVQVRIYDDKTFIVKEKRCNDCEEFKPIDEFTRNTNNKIDGRDGRCKSCSNKNTSGVITKVVIKKKRNRIISTPSPVRPKQEIKKVSTSIKSTKGDLTRPRQISKKLNEKNREKLNELFKKQKRFLDGDIDKEMF